MGDRILVTGGAGFIGRVLVAALVEDALLPVEMPVLVLDNLRRSSAGVLQPLVDAGKVTFIEGDIRDSERLRELMRGVAVVFHLAAQSNVIGSESDPDYAYTTNVTGTYHILQEAGRAGVRRVVFTSSREVYGEAQSLPVSEYAPIRPQNMYGASKAADEMLARAAVGRWGMEVAAPRIANVYGPGDRDRVIPLWIGRALAGQEMLVYGGRQIIDFIWLGDVVRALTDAAWASPDALRPAFDAIGPGGKGFFARFNLGTGRGTSILDLAERLKQAMRSDVPVTVVPPRSEEVERFVADPALLHTILGLRPDPPLAHLDETVRAYTR